MAASKDLPRDVVCQLLESEDGVAEVYVRKSEVDGTLVLEAVGVRVVSGSFPDMEAEQLLSAFDLDAWAKQNRSIFETGRVAY